MEVKGAAFVGRKDAVIKQFGDSAWAKFIEGYAEKDPYFKNSILSTTSIPADKFLAFEEALITNFYNGDKNTYWKHGEQAAEYSLVNGPYKIYLSSKDVKMFVEERLAAVWRMYYNEGEMVGKVEGNVAEVFINNVPISHIYFEYTVMGYAHKAIELVGAKIIEIKKVKGPSMGTKDSHYQFILG